jgi:hypothetical protein
MKNNSLEVTKPSKLAYLKALNQSFNKGFITKKQYKAERKLTRNEK